MEKTLITGGAGFIGSNLARCLRESENVVLLDKRTLPEHYPELSDLQFVMCDILNIKNMRSLFKQNKFTKVYHLAAQPFPTPSIKDPTSTFNNNIIGASHVFDLCEEFGAKLVFASSSAIYGAAFDELQSNLGIDECATAVPLHPYGLSKFVSDWEVTFRAKNKENFFGCSARIFNTSGAYKIGDVFSDWASQIAAGKNEISVGNLDTSRAYLHVLDTVNSLITIMDSGENGVAYNISGETLFSGRQIIEAFGRVTGQKINTQTSSSLVRKSDEPYIIGSNLRLHRIGGRQPQLQLDDIVRDIYVSKK